MKPIGVRIVVGRLVAVILAMLVALTAPGGGTRREYADHAPLDVSVAHAASANPLPMQIARKRFALAALGNTIYAVGGIVVDTNSDLQYTETVEAYDLTTRTWTFRAPLPVRRSDTNLVALGGKLYAIGGIEHIGSETRFAHAVYRYDPLANRWDVVAAYPVQVTFSGAAVSGGKIYVIGGSVGPTWDASNLVYAYDPALDRWSQQTSMPTSRRSVQVVPGPDGRIYAVGGGLQNGQGWTNLMEVYTPSLNSWAAAASLPVSASSFYYYTVAPGANGRIYTFGGAPYGPDGPGIVFEYDPIGNQWTPRAAVPTPRSDASAASGPDGLIYVAGGHDPLRQTSVGYQSAIVETYDPVLNTWSEDQTPLTLRSFTINGGAQTTTSPQVGVRLEPSVPQSGSSAGEMSFSTDGGTTWSGWTTFQALSTLTLPGGDGRKTVHARVRNGVGVVSPSLQAQIALDTSHGNWFGPLINGGAPFTNTLDVTLTVVPAPWGGLMQISNDSDFAGAVWEPHVTRKAWRLPDGAPGTPRTVYARFLNLSGYASAGYRDDIVLDVTPPSGSVALPGAGTSGERGVASPTKNIQLAATDDLSSQAQMATRLSNRPDFAGAIWKPFASSVTWDFTGGATVYAQFKDGAGNISQTYSQSVAGSPSGGVSPAPSCSPRPRIDVHTETALGVPEAGGAMKVTVTTSGANNGLRAVRFDSFSNAIVQAGSQTNQSAPFAVSIPPGQEPTSLVFYVRRQTPGQATTVRLVVIDGCGEWSTFVGGGPNAF